MTEQDKIGFKQMMDTVTTLYQKHALDIDTLRVWFYKFDKYEFGQVSKAFDKWVDQSKFMPTPADILQLVKEKPVEYIALQAPKLNKDQNKAYSSKIVEYIVEKSPQDKKLKDMRAWAHRIINNPKNYPAISLKFAKEAVNAN
jgi:hypothetical protein